MPTPEQIQDALDNITNPKEQELVSHILKGTRIPRALPANKDDVPFQGFLEKWRQNQNIGGLDINALDNAQNGRMSLIQAEIELRSLNTIQKTFQPPSPQPEQPQQSQNTRRISITHQFKAQSTPSPEPRTPEPVLNDVLDTTKEDVMRLLVERLKEIKSEVKGFRPGHDQRLIAIALIINEVQKSAEKLASLEGIEKMIQDLKPEDLKRKISEIPAEIINKKVRDEIVKKIEKDTKGGPGEFFKEGISSDSTSKKGAPSQYAQMKKEINENLKPVKSTHGLK